MKGMHIAAFPHHPDVVPLLIPNDAFNFRSHYSAADHTETVDYLTQDGEASWEWFPGDIVIGRHGSFTVIPGSWTGTFITNHGLVATEDFAPGKLSGHFSTEFVWSMQTGDYVHQTAHQIAPHDAFLFI